MTSLCSAIQARDTDAGNDQRLALPPETEIAITPRGANCEQMLTHVDTVEIRVPGVTGEGQARNLFSGGFNNGLEPRGAALEAGKMDPCNCK